VAQTIYHAIVPFVVVELVTFVYLVPSTGAAIVLVAALIVCIYVFVEQNSVCFQVSWVTGPCY
jgi:hypothetical protein